MHVHEPAQFSAPRLTALLFLITAVAWFVVAVVSPGGVDVASLALGVVFAGIGVYYLTLGRGSHVN